MTHSEDGMDQHHEPAVVNDEADRRNPFANFGRTFKKVAGVVARTAASAAELLRDEEMRKRGAKEIADRARVFQQEVRNTINKAPKSLQGVLDNVQRRISDVRLRARLEASLNTKVDVQVGLTLYNGIPQEWRQRLWMAVLQNPACTAGFADISESMRVSVRNRLVSIQRSRHLDEPLQSSADEGAAAGQSSSSESAKEQQGHSIDPAQQPDGVVVMTAVVAAVSDNGSDTSEPDVEEGLGSQHGSDSEQDRGLPKKCAEGKWHAETRTHQAGKAEDGPTDQEVSCIDNVQVDGVGSTVPSSSAVTVPVNAKGPLPSPSGRPPRGTVEAGRAARAAAARSEAGQHTPVKVSLSVLPAVEEGGPPVVAVSLSEGPPKLPRAPHKRHLSDMTGESNRAAPSAQSVADSDGSSAPSDSSAPSTTVRSAVDAGSAHFPTDGSPAEGSTGKGPEVIKGQQRTESGDLGEWEVLQRQGSLLDSQGRWLLMQAGRQKLEWADDVAHKQDALVDEVDAVELPVVPDPDCEEAYHMLLASPLPAEQEDLDDVIGRDIHRTFPEHPQFGFQQGQQQLFRVLKAYALHDTEVGYCQGMAFLVGILLMYLPEEPTFRVAKLLLQPPGPNLRRLYLPTMDGLKLELRKFEWLMKRFLPKLLAHLESHGVVSVLYAAQWFLTVFSCPFPPTFACRMIDIMLWERSDNIMQRTALAIMAECGGELMELHDFEEIITHLKMQLAGWGGKRARRVLSNALWSPITSDILQAAEDAVQSGFVGSFARMSSRNHTATEGLESAPSPHVESKTGPLPREDSTSSVLVHGPTVPQGDEDEYLRMVMEMDGLWGPVRQVSAAVDMVDAADQNGSNHTSAAATTPA